MHLAEITAGNSNPRNKITNSNYIYKTIISLLNHVFKIVLIIMTTDFTNQQQISNIICM